MKKSPLHRYEISLAVPNATSSTPGGSVALEKVTLTVCATREVAPSDMAELESRLSGIFRSGKPLSATSMKVRKLPTPPARAL